MYQSEQGLHSSSGSASFQAHAKHTLCLTPLNSGCEELHKIVINGLDRYLVLDEAAIDVDNDGQGDSAFANPVVINEVYVSFSTVYTGIYLFKCSMSLYIPQLSNLEGHTRICLTAE